MRPKRLCPNRNAGRVKADLAEKGRLITYTVTSLISIDNIECCNLNVDSKEYYIEVVLQLVYKLKDGGTTKEIINVAIVATVLDDSIYSVKNVYRVDEDE